MDIENVIAALKARCPSFGDAPNRRFAGAAEFSVLSESTKMELPAGYVIPLDDEASQQESSNGYKQLVRDVIGVVVVMDNTPNERGQTAVSQVRALRAELFKALLGWMPDAEHDRIEYEGGQLLATDRSKLYYQFEFSADTELGVEDTYQAILNEALPQFDEMGINLDAIDPFDPNLVSIGPDGRIEVTADITVPQD